MSLQVKIIFYTIIYNIEMPMGKMGVASKGKTPYRSRGKKYVTKKQLYRAIHSNIENKIISDRLVTNFSSVSNTWSELPIMLVAQGTGNNQRIGNQIRLKSIELNGVIAQGSSASPADDIYNVMRIVIAAWSGSTVTTPLQSAAVGLDAVIRRTNAPQGLLKKYHDKYIPLTVASTTDNAGNGYCPNLRKFKYFKVFKKPLLIDFGAATTLTPDKRVIVSMLSDSFGIPNPGFITGYWAVSYEDA